MYLTEEGICRCMKVHLLVYTVLLFSVQFISCSDYHFLSVVLASMVTKISLLNLMISHTFNKSIVVITRFACAHVKFQHSL